MSAGRIQGSRGFTLVELLVVVAILAILTALLLPALGLAKGLARSASCKSNLHHLGLGLSLYLHDSRDRYPREGIMPHSGARSGSWTTALLPVLSGTGNRLFCPARPVEFPTIPVGSSPSQGVLWSGVAYDYNTQGTARRLPRSRLGLAWVEIGGGNFTTHDVIESQIAAPSDMIVLTEPDRPLPQIAVHGTGIELMGTFSMGGGSTNWTGAVHHGTGNALLGDGHVESQKQARWQEPTTDQRSRWNIDNQPHPETW